LINDKWNSQSKRTFVELKAFFTLGCGHSIVIYQISCISVYFLKIAMEYKSFSEYVNRVFLFL